MRGARKKHYANLLFVRVHTLLFLPCTLPLPPIPCATPSKDCTCFKTNSHTRHPPVFEQLEDYLAHVWKPETQSESAPASVMCTMGHVSDMPAGASWSVFALRW